MHHIKSAFNLRMHNMLFKDDNVPYGGSGPISSGSQFTNGGSDTEL